MILNSISMANGSPAARTVQRLEVVVDGGEMLRELRDLRVAHEQFIGDYLIGGGQHDVAAVGNQQECLGHRVRLGIGDQIFADLCVDVVPAESAEVVERVEADGDAVGQPRLSSWDATSTPIAADGWSMRWKSRSVKARKFQRLANTPLRDLSMPSSTVSSGSWVLESYSPAPLNPGRSSLLVLDRYRSDVPAGNVACISVSASMIHWGESASLMSSRRSSSMSSWTSKSAWKSGSASISSTRAWNPLALMNSS